MEKNFAKIDSILDKYSCTQINLISLLVIVLISMIDLVVGYEIAISIFFLVPIAISTWYCRYRVGIFLSILSAAIWFSIDYTGHEYANLVAPYWNALVRLGISWLL